MWESITGQEHAVTTLRAAAERPSHAYLLVGSKGSGVLAAARAFACEVIGVADERSVGLVARGVHPDVVEFEPTTATYTLPNEIRAPRGNDKYRRDPGLPRVIPEIHKAPVEGTRKVVVLLDVDRMEPTVGNALLKSIEEPPPRTVILLLTNRPEGLLATIRSRCQRIDFAYAPPARTAAIDTLRSVFSGIVGRVDGRAGTAVALVEELEGALAEAVAAAEAAAAAEVELLDEQIEARGYPPRTAASLRKRMGERHVQEVRRARVDALIEGIGAMEQVYVDVLADAPDEPTIAPGRVGDALGACRAARQADEFNPNVG